MAAPADAQFRTMGFRDAKGNTSRMRVLLGAATDAALQTAFNTLQGHVQAITNAAEYDTNNGTLSAHRAYGTSAEYNTVEDKAVLTFVSQQGTLHRYQVPAPKTAIFMADQETVDATQADMAAVITDFQTSVYGLPADTAPVTYVGGTRIRRKLHRKATIFDKNPALTGPEE